MTESCESWIGREERARSGLDPWPAKALRATLGLDSPEAAPHDALPPLWSWLYFLDTAPRDGIGRDGHAALGGFMPPVPAERRMFAGARLTFLRPLRIGRPADQVRRIDTVEAKTGGAGPMSFVTVAYDHFQDGELCVEERRDIVYLQSAPGTIALPPSAPIPDAPLSLEVTPDAVMLARYSALTFNGHRIHYDLPYARDVEGYPERVVHGPMVATLLAELARLKGGLALSAFAFRAHSPLFLGDTLHLRGGPDDGGGMALKAYAASGRPIMTANAKLA